MPQVVDEFNGDFIGIVKGYDIESRELDVFIPKLMPQIPMNRVSVNIKTNLSNKDVITHQSMVTTASTIKVKAYDTDEPLPDINSKVRINFLEGNYYYGYWRKFNMRDDYSVIESEKYPKRMNLQVGSKNIDVNQDDTVIINLPEGYKVTSYSKSDKVKVLNVIPEKLFERVITLEEYVGHDKGTDATYETSEGEILEANEATGIFKMRDDIFEISENIIDINSNITKIRNDMSDTQNDVTNITNFIGQYAISTKTTDADGKESVTTTPSTGLIAYIDKQISDLSKRIAALESK